MLLITFQIKLHRHTSHFPEAYNIKWAITIWAIAQKKQCADKRLIAHSFKSVYAEILVSISLGLLVRPTD